MSKLTHRKILEYLASGALISATILLSGSRSWQLLKTFLKYQKFKRSRFRDMLIRMKKSRLISIVSKGGETYLVITDKGHKHLQKYQFEDLQIAKPKYWDGKWRMVIFDIPERFKKAREALRHKLKDLGFYQFQKSVFVYPYECRNEIDFVSSFFGINKYVSYLLVEDADAKHFLQSHFHLI